MFYFVVLYLLFSIGFLINSIIFLIRKHWVKYRIIAISVTILIGLLILSTRAIVTEVVYGEIIHKISNQDDAYTLIKIRLFENNRFISETYNLSCNIENIGTYKLTGDKLTLVFEGEKSEYLDTHYQLNNDTLKSYNNEYKDLIIKKD